MGLRRKAREFVVQALYSWDVSETNYKVIHQEFVSVYELKDKLEQFFSDLFFMTVKNVDFSDRVINKYIQNWDFDRLAHLDKAILRMAITEFFYFDSIPFNATIDEAVDIAKKYSTDKSGSFINGVLDNIKLKEVKDVRK